MVTFKELVCIIDKQGESDADIKAHIDKVTAAFPQLKNI